MEAEGSSSGGGDAAASGPSAACAASAAATASCRAGAGPCCAAARSSAAARAACRAATGRPGDWRTRRTTSATRACSSSLHVPLAHSAAMADRQAQPTALPGDTSTAAGGRGRSGAARPGRQGWARAGQGRSAGRFTAPQASAGAHSHHVPRPLSNRTRTRQSPLKARQSPLKAPQPTPKAPSRPTPPHPSLLHPPTRVPLQKLLQQSQQGVAKLREGGGGGGRRARRGRGAGSTRAATGCVRAGALQKRPTRQHTHLAQLPTDPPHSQTHTHQPPPASRTHPLELHVAQGGAQRGHQPIVAEGGCTYVYRGGGDRRLCVC